MFKATPDFISAIRPLPQDHWVLDFITAGRDAIKSMGQLDVSEFTTFILALAKLDIVDFKTTPTKIVVSFVGGEARLHRSSKYQLAATN